MSLIVATVVGAILFLIRAICLVALLVISGNEGDLSAAGKGMSYGTTGCGVFKQGVQN